MGIIECILDRIFEHKILTTGCDGQDDQNPYLKRWYIRKRRGAQRGFQLYLHKIIRPDHDRALHDHPWWFWALVLWGGYVEEVMENGGQITRRHIGWLRLNRKRAEGIHRIDSLDGGGPTWTLFLTGPLERDWGFWESSKEVPDVGFDPPLWGWTHWRAFMSRPGRCKEKE